MLPAERRNYIINVIRSKGKVEVDNLAQQLKVSPMTIRRDLALLAEQGFIDRTHGGAVLPSVLSKEEPYQSKETALIEQKQRIGQEAAKLVQDGQVIILDSGTTTLEIAKEIKNLKDLTVVTNDLKIALELSETTDFQVFCTGGIVQNGVASLMGTHAASFLSGIKADITFLGTSAVDLEWGITTPNLEKATLKQRMMAAADKVVLVTDYRKFGQRAFAQIAKITDIDLLVCDDGLKETTIAQLKKLGVAMRIV